MSFCWLDLLWSGLDLVLGSSDGESLWAWERAIDSNGAPFNLLIIFGTEDLEYCCCLGWRSCCCCWSCNCCCCCWSCNCCCCSSCSSINWDCSWWSRSRFSCCCSSWPLEATCFSFRRGVLLNNVPWLSWVSIPEPNWFWDWMLACWLPRNWAPRKLALSTRTDSSSVNEVEITGDGLWTCEVGAWEITGVTVS